MNEHSIQNEIRIELTKLGYTVFRVNVGKVKLADGRYFDTGLPKGFSDLMLIKDGKVSFLEVKNDKGKPSKEQINFIKQMILKGCRAGVVRSVAEALEVVEPNYWPDAKQIKVPKIDLGEIERGGF